MTDAASPPVASSVRSDRVMQLRAGGVLVGVLAVLGAVLGIVWEAWSPPGPAGAVLQQGIQADETEAFIGGDGRFVLMTLIVGLAAGVATWYVPKLKRARGPYVAIALAVGGAAGAALTEWVGYLIRGQGGSFQCNSATGKCIDHLPLTVHMHAVLLIEATAAVLVYSLFVAFAVADDLGRPDLGRSAARAAAQPPVHPHRPPPQPAPAGYAPPPSVGTERDPQQPWRHGDTPGPA